MLMGLSVRMYGMVPYMHPAVLALDPFREIIPGVHQTGDDLLVGNGDVEAAAAHGVESVEHIPEMVLFTGQSEIAPVQPELSQGRVVHRW